MSGNEDGSAVTYAVERLMKQKERSKTLIVLSDGDPTGEGIGNKREYLKDIVEDIEAQGHINIAAIGILTNAVQRFYTNFTVLDDTLDIESALLEVVKKSIIR